MGSAFIRDLVMGWQCGQGPWKRFPYIQVSDVLCYKLIPIIYRTSLLQNSLNVIISNCRACLYVHFILNDKTFWKAETSRFFICSPFQTHLYSFHRSLQCLSVGIIFIFISISVEERFPYFNSYFCDWLETQISCKMRPNESSKSGQI